MEITTMTRIIVAILTALVAVAASVAPAYAAPKQVTLTLTSCNAAGTECKGSFSDNAKKVVTVVWADVAADTVKTKLAPKIAYPVAKMPSWTAYGELKVSVKGNTDTIFFSIK